MIQVQVRGAQKLSIKLNKIQNKLNKLPQESYKEFVKLTPVGDPNRWNPPRKPKGYTPGNARRKTKLQGNTIKADYPYAKRLDEGYSSQAKNGMTKPLIDWIRKRVRDILAGK